MFDLLPDGKIAIDFVPADGPPRRVVVNPPPTVGALKRLRRKANDIDQAAAEYAISLDAPPAEPAEPLTAGQKRALIIERNDESAVAWWKFVMLGDETWKGLAPDAPDDTEDWPIYLSSIESMSLAQGHWRVVPLARGGKPAEEMN